MTDATQTATFNTQAAAVSDTGGIGNNPPVLNPIVVPDLDPGAMNTEIPSQLHTTVPLWARNVAPVWQQMGLAVPGCGGRLRTANPNISLLFDRVGQHVQSIAFHPCARMSTWPEVDILKTMHTCYINARDFLNSRLIADSVIRPRATVVGSQAIPFKCYFMPFYGPYLRNGEIRFWLMRIMELMTHLMVADENAFSYGLGQLFVDQVAVPLRDSYQFMLANLLKVDPTKITDEYVATDADFAAYNAAKNSASTNLANSQGSIDPTWHPSAMDRQWCAGAYTYLEAAPLLAIYPEGSAPAPASIVTGQTALDAAIGGINTTK